MILHRFLLTWVWHSLSQPQTWPLHALKHYTSLLYTWSKHTTLLSCNGLGILFGCPPRHVHIHMSILKCRALQRAMIISLPLPLCRARPGRVGQAEFSGWWIYLHFKYNSHNSLTILSNLNGGSEWKCRHTFPVGTGSLVVASRIVLSNAQGIELWNQFVVHQKLL